MIFPFFIKKKNCKNFIHEYCVYMAPKGGGGATWISRLYILRASDSCRHLQRSSGAKLSSLWGSRFPGESSCKERVKLFSLFDCLIVSLIIFLKLESHHKELISRATADIVRLEGNRNKSNGLQEAGDWSEMASFSLPVIDRCSCVSVLL